MPRHFETVIIFTPTLSEDEVKKSVLKYSKLVTDQGASIIEERNWGLKHLAYPIMGKSNGIYYIMEFATDNHQLTQKLEIEYKRDESILRFLTIRLDKYGITYNDRRRKGEVGKNSSNKQKETISEGTNA